MARRSCLARLHTSHIRLSYREISFPGCDIHSCSRWPAMRGLESLAVGGVAETKTFPLKEYAVVERLSTGVRSPFFTRNSSPRQLMRLEKKLTTQTAKLAASRTGTSHHVRRTTESFRPHTPMVR